eukprot:TRINITY_DN21866_c0_g2_i1.p2 TRINITY_DN21866_c0_g2~~TRINITY_DN21866_c0_g2_i1.p2  ORF type:complete len:211 (+),score=55.95 TRINITY_DN21866_c0_g2_i1:71-634(+)
MSVAAAAAGADGEAVEAAVQGNAGDDAAPGTQPGRKRPRAAEDDIELVVPEDDVMRRMMGFTGFTSMRKQRCPKRDRRRKGAPLAEGEGDAGGGAKGAEELEAERIGGWEAPQVGKRYSGVVERFWPDRGYGFIRCPALGNHRADHVFLHVKQLKGHFVGDQVTFVLLFDKKSRMLAEELQPVEVTL